MEEWILEAPICLSFFIATSTTLFMATICKCWSDFNDVIGEEAICKLTKEVQEEEVTTLGNCAKMTWLF
ncbi:Proteasome activator complex subunit 4 [Sesbania bispinosa]|nr:Proteasome activator complex subunit 4 [Sesbania bispinosa]